MNLQENRDTRLSGDHGILDSVDRAVAERMQAGRADEDRHGFPALVANATPSIDEGFQQALRARLLAELTESAPREKRKTAVRERIPALNSHRLYLVGAVAAAVVLALALVAFPSLRVWQQRDISEGVPPRLDPGDVDALAARLNREPGPRAVVVFPGDYAETLAGYIEHPVLPLRLDGALRVPAIHAVLGAALPSSGLVDVIMVDQEGTEVQAPVRSSLEQQLYRLYRPGETGTESFGALERNQYLVGPEDAALEPIGAVFENGVELVAAGVLDELQAGAPLRVALDWRIREPVDEAMVVFAHVVLDDGLRVAQRDAVPGNGEFPVEEWSPGEVVRDQFALQLLPDLPAGQYEIYVGSYSPATGARYALIEAGTDRREGNTAIVIQQLTVEGTSQQP